MLIIDDQVGGYFFLARTSQEVTHIFFSFENILVDLHGLCHIQRYMMVACRPQQAALGKIPVLWHHQLYKTNFTGFVMTLQTVFTD
jgi:hypothetical protein